MPFTTEMGLEKLDNTSNPDEAWNDSMEILDSGGTYKLVAAEAIDKGEWVKQDASNEGELAQADSVANAMVLGIATADTALGDDVYVRYSGVIEKSGWGLTVSSQYYLSPTVPGGMTTTRPTGSDVVVELGESDDTGEKFYIRIRIYNTTVAGGQHSTLTELDWSVAGHIIDATLDMNSNEITEVGQITGNTFIQMKVGASGDRGMYFEVGDSFYIRDADDSFTARWTLASATGDVTMTGDLAMGDGNIDNVASIDGGGDAIVCSDDFQVNGGIGVNIVPPNSNQLTIKSQTTAYGGGGFRFIQSADTSYWEPLVAFDTFYLGFNGATKWSLTSGGIVTNTGGMYFDDGSGNSPICYFRGGTNDDQALFFLNDHATTGYSDMVIRLCDAAGQSQLQIQDNLGVVHAYVDSDGNADFDGTVTVFTELVIEGTPAVSSNLTIDTSAYPHTMQMNSGGNRTLKISNIGAGTYSIDIDGGITVGSDIDMQDNSITDLAGMDGGGDAILVTDNLSLASNDIVFGDGQGAIFGTGSDAKIYYTGSDLYINPAVVGSGSVYFVGNTRLDDSIKHYFGTGKDVEAYYDGTDFIVRTDLVAASDMILDCGTNKTLELYETVYKDTNVGGVTLKSGASNQPTLVVFDATTIQVYEFSASQTNELHGTLEIQHDYKEGEDIVPHIHWYPTNTDTGNVRWGIEYTLEGPAGTVATGTSEVLDAGSGTAWQEQRKNFATLSGTGVTIGMQLHFRLYREGGDGTDTYNDGAAIATIGIHYPVDTLGSRQITTK